MIIECPCKKKKFNIDINLIPAEGRNLQCGSCDRVWFYKNEELISDPSQVSEDIAIKEIENSDKLNDDKSKHQLIKQPVENEKVKSKLSTINETENKSEEIKKTKSSKFFSYLIVFIISLGALIILLDTLKTPLVNIFPGLEVLLFNLYETLKDIKLFIIDLS